MGALDNVVFPLGNSNSVYPVVSLQQAMPYIYRPVVPEPSDNQQFTSYLGTPVYSNLVFPPNQGVPNDAGLPLRIDTVLFSVANKKIVVATEVVGRVDNLNNPVPGTIKEYISTGDYEISMQGMIVSPYGNLTPTADVRYLDQICKLNKQILVNSDFLNHFGIKAIVITDWRISEVMGSRNQYMFQIQALSDDDPTISQHSYYQT